MLTDRILDRVGSSYAPACGPSLALASAPPPPEPPSHPPAGGYLWLILAVIASLALLLIAPDLFAQARLPGSDESGKLEAAGTLLRLVDTMLFTWGARVFAGICILSAGWNLKEQRYGLVVLSIIGAVVIGSAPFWVRNIFEIGGGTSIFSEVHPVLSGLAHV